METQQETMTNQEDKTIAIVAYLTVVGLIIAFVLNQNKKDPLGSYHIRQMLGIVVVGFVLGIIGIIPILGWIIAILGGIFMFILWIVGLINAVGGKKKPVPVLGKKFEEWFKSI